MQKEHTSEEKRICLLLTGQKKLGITDGEDQDRNYSCRNMTMSQKSIVGTSCRNVNAVPKLIGAYPLLESC